MKNVTTLLVLLPAAAVCLLSSCDQRDGADAKSDQPGESAADASSPAKAESRGSTAQPETAARPAATAAGEVSAPEVNYEAWFKKHKLNLEDPGMLDADPDADGFSNRDEFLADTDPTSGESRPGFHKTLRLREYNEVKLPIVLQGIENNRAKIQRADAGSSSVETVKQGDTIRGTGLKVSKIRQRKEVDKNGVEIDVSEVIAENTSSGEKVILVKDMAPRSSESYAVLGAADGEATVKVKQGEKFNWPGEPDKTYRVIDLRPTQVVVEHIETRKTFTIPKSE